MRRQSADSSVLEQALEQSATPLLAVHTFPFTYPSFTFHPRFMMFPFVSLIPFLLISSFDLVVNLICNCVIYIYIYIIYIYIYYDFMYMKTKEETQGIQNIGIEDSQWNTIVEQSQVLKIWENYITELYDRPNRPETLEVEPEEEVDTDETGPYILQSEVEKAIKEMRNKKATGDDDVPGDVLKLLGGGGLKIMTKLINAIYETGEWPRDFTEVTTIALKKTPQATKCSNHRTIGLVAHTAKIEAKILGRRIERKIENVLGEDQFGSRRGKGTRDAIGMLRIIAERTLEIDTELCVCFIDW